MELLGVFTLIGSTIQANLYGQVATVSREIAVYTNAILLSAVTIWVMVMGFAVMRGEVQNPINSLIWKWVKMSLIFFIGLSGGYYMNHIVPLINGVAADLMKTFANANGGDCVLVGGDPLGVFKALDCSASASMQIIASFFNAALNLSSYSGGAVDGIISVALFVFVGGLLVIGTVILYGLLGLEFMGTQIAMVMVLCVGPMFIACAAFEPTKKYFEGWLSKIIYCVLLQGMIVLFLGLVVSTLTVFMKDIIGTMPTDASLLEIIANVAARPMKTMMSFIALILIYLIFAVMSLRLGGIAGQLVGHMPQTSGLGTAAAQTAMNLATGGLGKIGKVTAKAGSKISKG